MCARKVVPILLIAGAVMLMLHHRSERMSRCEDGEQRRPIGPHGEWGKRVPPMFEKWHNLAHEAQSPAI